MESRDSNKKGTDPKQGVEGSFGYEGDSEVESGGRDNGSAPRDNGEVSARKRAGKEGKKG